LSNPLVSVVMSVYNSEKYLKEAIESILNQTYTNFEFIIVNDGSTDNSLDIIQEYMKKDERIVLISRENKGLPYSLNEGIEKAKGKYIARMDADDISLPTRFEEQVRFMEENEEVGVCGTSVLDIDTGDKWILTSKDNELKVQLLFSSVFAHPSVMIRKELFDSYSLSYDVNYRQSQDFELWTRMSEYTKFANLKKQLLKYRVLDDSITRKSDQDIDKRYIVIKSIFEKYLKKLNVKNTEKENRLHFNLTVNNRIKESKIDFQILNNYFKKIENANKEVKLFDTLELKKVLGKKWLWNLYYTKNIKGVFSSYLFYGIWSVLSK